MNLMLNALSPRTLRLLLLLSFLSKCSPQRNYNHHSNYPYSLNQYAANLKKNQFSRPDQHVLKRQTGNSGSTYSPNLLADASLSLKSQSVRQKISNDRSTYDFQNAKFAGASNQEKYEESEKSIGLLKKKKLKRLFLNPCFRSGSDKNAAKGQGRFLFDVNVYNIQTSNGGYGNGCGGLGGGFGGGLGGGLGAGLLSGGGGLFSDVLADAYPPTISPFQNLLSFLAPGILQNALAVTARPQLQIPVQADPVQADPVGSDTDPVVDPNYNLRPLPPVRRPNQIYYDSAGAAPLTPAQLVGGVATTVNGIIQQLTGNVQPVYPGNRRLFNYG